MKTYVISDIHGDKKRFMEMLRLIKLDKQDTLYILGDIIDRGDYGIELLEYVMEEENIIMIKGNHERMLQDCFKLDGTGVDSNGGNLNLWIHNGGYKDYIKLSEMSNIERNKKIFNYISNLPLFIDNLVINDKIYYLVHGNPITIDMETYKNIEMEAGHSLEDIPLLYEEELIWGRVRHNETYFEDKTVIFGHTPTNRYQSSSPLKIWHGNKIIGIDCGAGMGESNPRSRLACLCLDTMEEFYV